MPTVDGFDVSVWQGDIAWQKVPKPPFQFAIIKATEGNYGRDPKFSHNWQQAKQYGYLRASYHFLRGDSPGDQQAAYHHAYVRSNGKFAVGDACMVDVEKYGNDNPHLMLGIAEAFIQRMLKETQCGMFVYVGHYYWTQDMGNPKSALLAKCPLVIPSYGADPLTIPNWPSGATIWQYSDKGSVPGINGPVDVDRAFCDHKTLKQLFRVGGRK